MNTIEEEEMPVVPTYQSPWIFHQQAYRKLSGETAWRGYFQYKSDKVLAALHCCVEGTRANARSEGLFGCMDLFEGARAEQFMAYVLADLSQRGITEISMTLYPELYAEAAVKWQRQTLHAAQFLLENGGRNALIEVGGETEWQALAEIPDELNVTQEPLDQLSRIHQIFDQQDARRVRTGHMDFTSVEALVRSFPEQSYLFVVKDGAVPCAFGIVMDIGGGVLHTVYLEQLNDHFAFDPLLGLLQHLYDWAMLRDYKWIDLGENCLDLADKVECRHVSRECWIKRW